MESIRVHLPDDLRMNDDEFVRFCQDNPGLKVERRRNGDIVFMGLTGSETSSDNSELNADFVIWNRQYRFGKVFDSSGGFTLPDGSILSPDVAVVEQSRWGTLTADQRKAFAPICPDFILELRSRTDRLRDCREKMDDWMTNGCRLGWLLDLPNQTTYVYRPNQPTQEISGLGQLSGEDVLPGFTLNLASLSRA